VDICPSEDYSKNLVMAMFALADFALMMFISNKQTRGAANFVPKHLF
jgi:hypothetical protein